MWRRVCFDERWIGGQAVKIMQMIWRFMIGDMRRIEREPQESWSVLLRNSRQRVIHRFRRRIIANRGGFAIDYTLRIEGFGFQ